VKRQAAILLGLKPQLGGELRPVPLVGSIDGTKALLTEHSCSVGNVRFCRSAPQVQTTTFGALHVTSPGTRRMRKTPAHDIG
jgi:hypothetical protein